MDQRLLLTGADIPKPAVKADTRYAIPAGIVWRSRESSADPWAESVSVTGMDFYRLESGQIVEHWHNVDELGLLSQLGVVS